jgi:plasmid stabilization system protein ParE
MRFRIEFSAESERDFALIFHHLFESYRNIGESAEAALDHCEDRIREISAGTDGPCTAPLRVERHAGLLAGLRQLTIDLAIDWFEVNKTEQRVRILAVFFGSQNHVSDIPTRLLSLFSLEQFRPVPHRRVRRRSPKDTLKAAKDGIGRSRRARAAHLDSVAGPAVHYGPYADLHSLAADYSLWFDRWK